MQTKGRLSASSSSTAPYPQHLSMCISRWNPLFFQQKEPENEALERKEAAMLIEIARLTTALTAQTQQPRYDSEMLTLAGDFQSELARRGTALALHRTACMGRS